MQRYQACINVTSVTLGDGAGAKLQAPGFDNVLLGPGAGREVTTGTGNVIVGRHAGDPTASNQVVLSTASTGAVRARWDAEGNVQLAVGPSPVDAAPDPEPGYITVAQQRPGSSDEPLLAFKHHDGTTVRTSLFRSDAAISALAPLTTANPPGAATTSLVDDAASRRVRCLSAGDHVTLDDVSRPGAVVVHAASQPLTEPGGIPGAVSLVADAAARSVKPLVAGANVTLTQHADLSVGISATIPQETTGGGAVSLLSATDRLRRLRGGVNVTLDEVTDPTCVTLHGPSVLDALSDAQSSASALALGTGAGPVPSQCVAVGPGCLGSGGATGGNNVAVGVGSLASATTGADNTAVGASSLSLATTASQNTTLGSEAGLSLVTGTSNVAVGYRALRNGQGGGSNVALGAQAGTNVSTGQDNVMVGTSAGTNLDSGIQNTLVGPSAGFGVISGNSNTIVGRHSGRGAAVSGYVILADGNGNARAMWPNARNGLLGLDGGIPAPENYTWSLSYNATHLGLDAYYRQGSTTVSVVELGNERRLGTGPITASTSLSASHRNRLTTIQPLDAPVVITLATYTGITNGAEYEFFNDGTTYTVTFVAGAGAVVRSVLDRVGISSHGIAAVKYVGSSTFVLVGALE